MDYRVEKNAKKYAPTYKSTITCNFEECPLFSVCPQFQTCGTLYNQDKANLMFLFDNPSQEDVAYSVPAISEAGMLFRTVWLEPFLGTMGTPMPAYVISYLIRTPLDREPTTSEQAYCWDHFYTDLMTHRPRTIVGFGANIFSHLYRKAKNKEKLPDPDSSVAKLRQEPMDIQLADDYTAKLFIGYAPGYIVKSPHSRSEFTADRDRVIGYLRPDKKVVEDRPDISIDVKLIETVDDALKFIDLLTHGLPKDQFFDLAFDTETENLNRSFNNKFLSWQFSWKPNHAVFIPIEHPEMPLFAKIEDKVKLIAAFQKLLDSSPEESRISWIVAHNAKFDLSILYGLFRILPRGTIPIWDTLLGMHWLDENRKSKVTIEGKPYSLKTLGKELLYFTYKSEQLAARADGDLISLSFNELKDYGGTDTILTWHLKQKQMRLAQGIGSPNDSGLQSDNALPKLERFMRHYYSPASRAVAFMECNGLHVSKEQLHYLQGENSPIWNRIVRIENVELQESPEVLAFREEHKKTLQGESSVAYEEDLWGDTEEATDLATFNPNKKDQENAFYLDFLGLEPLALSKKTKKPTLNKAFLNHYADPKVYKALGCIKPYVKYYETPIKEDEEGEPIFPKNPLQLILEYRELTKLGNTYLESISEMIEDTKGDCIDSRVRASYWLSGTDTGRLSSSNPNLQNLPAGRSKMAKEIKNLFQAEPPSKRFKQGTALVQLDYKTAEVRWAAIFAKDSNLIRLFNEAHDSLVKACSPDVVMTNEEFDLTQLASDIHRRTASLMFGVEPAKVSKAQRQASKCLVGSTRLFTNQGIVPIESLVKDKDDDNWLQALDNVIVASRNKQTEVVGVNHKWVDSTIKLTTKVGVTIQGDHVHPLLVWQDCQLVEKQLADIKIGDYLVFPRTNDVWAQESPSIAASIENEQEITELESTVSCLVCGEEHGNLNTHIVAAHGLDTLAYRSTFPNARLVAPAQIAKRMNSLLGTSYNVDIPKYPTKLTPSLAKLLGYLVAEGDGQRYTMSGHADDAKEMLQDFMHCFFDCFGVSLEVSEYREFTDTGVIRLPQKVVRYLLDVGLIQGYSDTQRVPSIMFRATKSEIVSFLSAYFEGDGSVKDNQIVVTSASALLMQDIQMLLLSLNIIGSQFTEERVTPVGKETRSYYGLRLCIRDARLFQEHIGFVSQRKQKQAEELSRTSAGRDYIYGLEGLLTQLKKTYKRGRRWLIDGRQVRFGERITKGGMSEITHERLASRPYVLNALNVWSTSVGNSVYNDVKWLYETKAALIPVVDSTVIEGRVKVYDIEVQDTSHTFTANGLLSKNCITFGLIYGMGVQTLAANNCWSEKDAQDRVDMFFAAFPELKRWLDSVPEGAKHLGYVETKMGRRRRLSDLFESPDFKDRAKASRLAMNAPIQGQSSDGGTIGLFTFLQFLLDNKLERRWIVQNVVHDSCLVQVPIEDIEKALAAMQHYFVQGMADYIRDFFGYALPLPIECEIEVGLKYGDLTKWDGRPSTLPTLIEKIKSDAKELWYTKKEQSGKPPENMDLVPWDGK